MKTTLTSERDRIFYDSAIKSKKFLSYQLISESAPKNQCHL